MGTLPAAHFAVVCIFASSKRLKVIVSDVSANNYGRLRSQKHRTEVSSKKINLNRLSGIGRSKLKCLVNTQKVNAKDWQKYFTDAQMPAIAQKILDSTDDHGVFRWFDTNSTLSEALDSVESEDRSPA